MSTDLQAALDLTRPLLTQIIQIITPHLPALTDEARSSYPRPPQDFLSAAPIFAQAMTERHEFATLIAFDSAQILSHLNTATNLSLTLAMVAEIQQLLADGRLVHLADAYRPCLTAYGIAKEMEKVDPSLRQVIVPLTAVFKTRRVTPPITLPTE